jgi:hypothetical protein
MERSLKFLFEQLKIYFKTDRNYKIGLIASSITLFFVLWCSSGTLSPYALSAPDELAMNQYTTVDADTWAAVIPGGREALQCRYVANIDHGQFLATFLMVDGIDKSVWEGSVILRRVLYPILAYPFMKLMGFETGGFVANAFIHLAAFLLFVSFVRREIGQTAAVFAAWAVATFPGVAYFGGLPYSYAFILPGCLIIAILLWRLAEITEIKSIFFISLLLGIIFLGYDFLPIFGVAAFYILIRKRLYIGAVLAIMTMATPSMIFNLILKYYYEIDLINANTEMYKVIAFSYLGVFQNLFPALGIDPNSPTGLFLQENAPFPDLGRWLEYLKLFPVFLLFNFVFSTFAYLSVGFAIINLPKIFGQRLKLNSVEFGVLLAVFLIFAFNNLAPQYRTLLQFRGYGVARLYEPMFVVLILYIARKIQTLPELPLIKQRILLGVASFVIIGNLITSFSTLLPNNWGLGIYGNFYLQGATTKKTYSDFKEQIRKYGRYPLGTCGHMKEAKLIKN